MLLSRPAFTFVDLFAGLGGFHVALKGLGGEGVFAAEWDSKLNDLYSVNYGLDRVWSDLNDLAAAEDIHLHVPDHDLLTAGFPCQPFSKAGEQLGFQHTLQGQLFFKVFEILESKRPTYFILENVPNIVRHRNGATLTTIIDNLKALGYSVDYRQYSPHQFGIPQVRQRAYFVGSLNGLGDFNWPEISNSSTDIRSVIDPNSNSVRDIPSQTLRAMEMWDDFLRRSGQVKLPSFPIWAMEFRADYPFEDETPPALWRELGSLGLSPHHGSFGFPLHDLSVHEQMELIPSHARRQGDYSFPVWKQKFIRQNRQFYWDNHHWIDNWMNEWQPWNLPSSLQKFEWNAQGGDRRIDAYVIQVRASGIRVKRPSTAPSLIAMTHTQVPILGADLAGHRRYMSPRECAKLQSLESIQLPESDLAAYKALGNAVNAEVVKRIASGLLAPGRRTYSARAA